MKTKAQSALEYMMTYGWAILIIVIIAAILYSFGIFNPSANVTNTTLITGFSDVPVTSAAVNNTWFKVTLTDQYGQTIKITNVTLLSGSTTFTRNNCTDIVLNAGQYTSCWVRGNFTSGTVSVVGTVYYTVLTVTQVSTSTTGTIRTQNSGAPLYPKGIVACSLAYSLNKTSDNKSGTQLDNVSWTIPSGGGFAIIMAASGSSTFGGSFKMPISCYFAEQNAHLSNSSIVACPNQAAGSYNVNVTNTGDSVALAAYVFSGPTCYYSVNGTSGTRLIENTSLPTGANLYLCDAASNTPHDFLNSSVTDVNATNAEIGHQTGNVCYSVDPFFSFGNSVSLISLNTSFANVTKFSETGLPSNIEWNVTYDNQLKSTKSPDDMNFVTLPGNYSYSATAKSNSSLNCTTIYSPLPASGYDVAGTPKVVAFSASTSCLTTFSEAGLPTGTKWNATYDSAYNTSTIANLTFNSPAGAHGFTLYRQDVNGCVYIPLNATSLQPLFAGTLNAGAPQNIKYNLSYCLTTFNEQGLPISTTWNVTFNGTLRSATAATITFNTSNGTAAFQTHLAYSGGTPYCQTPISGVIRTGSNTNITYSSTCVTTTFSESGLKSGKNWSVTYSNITNSSLTSDVRFTTVPGTFSFYVAPQFNSSNVCEMALLSSNDSGRFLAGSTKAETFNETCAIYSRNRIYAGQRLIYNWSFPAGTFGPQFYYPSTGLIYAIHRINSTSFTAWFDWYEVNGSFVQYTSSPFMSASSVISVCPPRCPAAGVIGVHGPVFDNKTGYIEIYNASQGNVFNGSDTVQFAPNGDYVNGAQSIPEDGSVMNSTGDIYLPNPEGQISVIHDSVVLENITVGNFSRLSTPYYGGGNVYGGKQTGLTVDDVNNYVYAIVFPLNRTLVISGDSIVANISMVRPGYDLVDPFHGYAYIIDGQNGTNLTIFSGAGIIKSMILDKTYACSPPFTNAGSGCLNTRTYPIYNPGNHMLYVATDSGYIDIINGTVLAGNVTSPIPSNATITGLAYDAAKNYVYAETQSRIFNSSGNYFTDYITVINGTKGIANITVTTGAPGYGIFSLGSAMYDPSNGFIYIGDQQDNQTLIINQTSVITRLQGVLGPADLTDKYYEI